MISRLLALVLAACILPGLASAQTTQTDDSPNEVAAPAKGQSNAQPGPLRVGTKVAPPFVIERENGSYTGIAIDLLDSISESVGFEYELEAFALQELLDAAASGEVDLAVGAISITPERERDVDFSHAYYHSGLAIAVEGSGNLSWLDAAKNLMSPAFLSAIGALLLVLLITGLLMWFVEHRRNTEQFGGSTAEGIGNGFWWSAVTMTTVGYGDKAPITLPGRIIGLVWMFASVIIISSFTAAIASSLTLSGIGGGIESAEDLTGRRVGALADSTASEALRGMGARVKTFENGEAALHALGEGTVDAVVHDEAVLHWWIATSDAEGKMSVLPGTFEPQNYGFALPPGSPVREDLNLAILRTLSSDEWFERVERALEGQDEDSP